MCTVKYVSNPMGIGFGAVVSLSLCGAEASLSDIAVFLHRYIPDLRVGEPFVIKQDLSENNGVTSQR